MAGSVREKFKRSYKDEYEVLYEALCGTEGQEEDDDDFHPIELFDSNADEHYLNHRQQRYDESSESTENGLSSSINHIILPDLVLEKIFEPLTIQEKYYASLVCRNWYRGFYLANSWRTFIFSDTTLTRRIFNYYSGWQYMLDHLRVQLCLNRIGRFIKTLIFKPIYNFYNLYEFMNMISFYAEQVQLQHFRGTGSNISKLHYTFPCNMSNSNQIRLYGTGGKLLEALKRLLNNLPSLRNVELVDLMLAFEEAITFLDDLCYSHCLIMKRLVLINISKTQCELLHLGVFLNLQVLIISPQSLGENVLHLIGESKLQHLQITQNAYTPTDITAVSVTAWRKCATLNPNLKVHLTVETHDDAKLLWQPCTLVSSIVFSSKSIKLQPEVITQTVDLYSATLKTFGNLCLPKFHEKKSFHDRMDSLFIFLCNSCPLLETLVIREKISTSTVLLIIHTAKNVRNLYIRRNSVILRSDWPKHPEWSDKFYNWLKCSARSYETVENEVSKALGQKWKLLSDKEFKCINSKSILSNTYFHYF